MTRTALHSAVRDFGYAKPSQVAESILELKSRDFYKSMTTLHDPTLWQDVYRPRVRGIAAYVKIQILENTTVVISFKTLEVD